MVEHKEPSSRKKETNQKVKTGHGGMVVHVQSGLLHHLWEERDTTKQKHGNNGVGHFTSD